MNKIQKEVYSRLAPYLNGNNKTELPQNSFNYHLDKGIFVTGRIGIRTLETLVKEFNVSLHEKGMFVEA